VVVTPGVRGWNSVDKGVYTGRAPAALVDLKAVIRFLRYNKDVIPGNVDVIISDGTSAGGALSALLGATGNNPAYESYLRELGVAEERDDIFAAICYCPITDIEHADMAYEWLYNCTNTKARSLSPEQRAISDELASLYPEYLDSLGLKTPDGNLLSAGNYLDYLKGFLMRSAQKAKNAAFIDIGEETGVKFGRNAWGKPGEVVVDIDMEKYLDYVVNRTPLKIPPAFDKFGILNQDPSAENNEFGDEQGKPANFTAFSLNKLHHSVEINDALKKRIALFNPMHFIGDGVSITTQNWYIRHGALDRDTAFQIPINLYTKLNNAGYNVDFRLTWNRGHQGDYDLDNLFKWINGILH
jgi:hypothetical protein